MIMNLYFSYSYQNRFNTSYPKDVEITSPETLQRLVAKSDYTMACFKNGYTKKGNYVSSHRCYDDFLKSNCLYGDIDNDKPETLMTIQDFKSRFTDFEYYLTTSRSHQIEKKRDLDILPAADRFHFFFPMGVDIYNANEMRGLLLSMYELYFPNKELDNSCIDAARYFFANKINEVYYNRGKSIYMKIKPYYENKKVEETLKTIVVEQNRQWHAKDNSTVDLATRNLTMFYLDTARKDNYFSDYKEWIRLGSAMKNAGFTLQDWQYLSNQDAQTKGEAEYKWNTFNEKAGMGTLQFICNKYKFKKK